jgi:hypothetical protein
MVTFSKLKRQSQRIFSLWGSFSPGPWLVFLFDFEFLYSIAINTRKSRFDIARSLNSAYQSQRKGLLV